MMPAVSSLAREKAPASVTIEGDSAEWTGYINANLAATGYHEWRWRDVFATAFGHEPVYFAARRDGDIVGVLPTVLLDSRLFGRALVSLPFLNYGGIVADDGAAACALLATAVQFAEQRKCAYLELRHTAQIFQDLPCRRHKVAMLLPIQSPDNMWAGFDRKVRNQVRKAEKSGLTACTGGIELLDDFYAVFARNMRDLGTPVYSRTFFEQMLTTFPDHMRVHIVRKDRTPVAGGFTFRTRSTLEIPWASSVRDYNALCPNHLLYWHVLRSAAADGCARFDFGRSTPHEGTYKFKEQWGAQPLPLCWEYGLRGGSQLPNASPANPKYSLAIALWRRLPLGVANAIGPRIVRSIP